MYRNAAKINSNATQIKKLLGKSLTPLVGNVVLVVGKVSDHFINTVDADGREMIAERAQIPFGKRKQAVVNQALDDLTLDFKRGAGNVHQFVDAGKQASFVPLVNISQTGAVKGNDTDRTGLLSRTEQAVAAGQQFAQVKLQTAAHRANLTGFQNRIDEVLEIRQTVFGGHFEKFGIVVFPGKIRRHVIGRNRESKRTSLNVAFHHDRDIGLVNHVHFFFEIAIGKRLLDTGNNRMLVAQVFRADPIEGKVGKRRLRTPARRNVQVINQFLKSLLDLLVRKVIGANIRRQIGIDRRKSLSTGPFVL